VQPTAWRETLERIDALAAQGMRIVPQVPTRPTGMLFGLQSSFHPFISHPSYAEVAALPIDERVARLRDPHVRARLLREEPTIDNVIARFLISNWSQMFLLGDPPDYEPSPEHSAAAVAARQGRRPEEVVYDWMLERNGRQFMFAPLANYVDCNFDALREMMMHPRTVLGLSDGGAHCGLICDGVIMQDLAEGADRGERRAQLVRHGGDELVLHPVELGEPLVGLAQHPGHGGEDIVAVLHAG
jgi:N-acyl-D-aspartate/D-glutamate deacylase